MLRYHPPNNIITENAAYMVTFTTADKIRIFSDEGDAAIVVESILKGRSLHHYLLFGFVVMPDHVHLVLKPLTRQLSECIKSIKGSTARRINERNLVQGKVWQKRYWSRPIVDDRLLAIEVAYVENNPVKANMVGMVDVYPFSSARHRDSMDFDYLQ